jgi:hypothetical protein
MKAVVCRSLPPVPELLCDQFGGLVDLFVAFVVTATEFFQRYNSNCDSYCSKEGFLYFSHDLLSLT